MAIRGICCDDSWCRYMVIEITGHNILIYMEINYKNIDGESQSTEIGYNNLLSKESIENQANDPNTDQTNVIDLSAGINSGNSDAIIGSGSVDYAQTTMAVLNVNQDMQSGNFVSGTSGWQIKGDGTAEFSDGIFRGSISAATIDIGGADISSFHVDIDGNLWSGAATLAEAKIDKFAVENSGTLYAYNGVIAGTLTIGGRLATIVGGAINADGDFINDLINSNLDTDAKTILGDFTFGESGAIKMITDSNNGLWISPTGIFGKKDSHETFSIGIDGSANFAGTLTAADGTLGSITAGNFSGISIAIGSSNNIFKADANGIYLGNATFASAPFRVSMDGSLTATSATIAGYKLFEAIVAPSGGNYTSVSAALVAGKTRIFVRNGTYTNETGWNISNDNTIITGESSDGVNITFGNTNPLINISSKHVILEKMKLTTPNVNVGNFINFATGAQYPKLINLSFVSGGTTFTGDFIDGNTISNLHGVFKDLYFDYTNKTTGNFLNALDQVNIYDSIFYMPIDSSPTVFNSLSHCNFNNCKFIVPDTNTGIMIISNTSGCSINTCYFRIVNINIDSNCYNCIFETNNQTAGGYFLSLNTGKQHFIGNTVSSILNTDDIKILDASAAGMIITNNNFNGGGLIEIQHSSADLKGGIFSNNVWNGYASAGASAGYDCDLRLGTHILQWNILGNILRNITSGGATPAITDNGTGNTNANNQLIVP